MVVRFSAVVAKDIQWKKGDIKCALVSSGSYAMGGNLQNEVIELVLVCPKAIRRTHFFKFFPLILKEQHLVSSIEVNVFFVRLNLDTVTSQTNLLDNTLLKELDDISINTINGPRLSQFCKNQIQQDHVRIFQVSLQIIKYWSIQRGIHSLPMGYLNDTSCTLLLVKTYKSIHNRERLNINSLINQFFYMWSQWPWITPVLLTEHIPDINNKKIDYNATSYSQAIMPILSPCHPVCNTAPNVTKSTLKAIQLEFERGNTTYVFYWSHTFRVGWCVLDRNDDFHQTIQKLFHPINYLNRYKHFISIVGSSETITTHQAWVQRMPGLIPRYVEMLEEDLNIQQIQPITTPQQTVARYTNAKEKADLEHGKPPRLTQDRLDNTSVTGTIYLSYYTIGFQLNETCKSLDISKCSDSFLSILKSKIILGESILWVIKHSGRKEALQLLPSIIHA
ncbi:hypothetical protein G6F56_000224 [Rhizopus delemar]|nr:hypothetical protein G6F56_000224 [Rhizopus delemar]